jgi:4-hydroxy-tetrahydrodipicolinate synthase
MSIKTLRGVIPPVPTIMNEQGHFDPEGMGVLIDRLLETEVNGFLFLGSAGEFTQMSREERKQVAEYCVKHVAGRRPVIIGTASCSTDEVIELSNHAAEIGADAVIVVNPYYSLLTEERIYGHFRHIAEAVKLPVLLYNFPALTGQDLSVEMIKRLARDCPNIIGIKETVDCMSHIRLVTLEVKALRPDFLVFCGFDEYVLDTLLVGGDGVIPATSNFAPELTCGIYKAFCEGDFPTIKKLVPRLARLSKIYSTDTPFAGLIKEALCMTGSSLPTGVSLPATKPDASLKQRLREILVQAEILH